jgi:hypothetical protein
VSNTLLSPTIITREALRVLHQKVGVYRQHQSPVR